MSTTTVESAFDEFRTKSQADGTDLELIDRTGGHVRVRLVVTEVACMECIMDREHLEQLLRHVLREADPTVESVAIEDQRV